MILRGYKTINHNNRGVRAIYQSSKGVYIANGLLYNQINKNFTKVVYMTKKWSFIVIPGLFYSQVGHFLTILVKKWSNRSFFNHCYTGWLKNDLSRVLSEGDFICGPYDLSRFISKSPWVSLDWSDTIYLNTTVNQYCYTAHS